MIGVALVVEVASVIELADDVSLEDSGGWLVDTVSLAIGLEVELERAVGSVDVESMLCFVVPAGSLDVILISFFVLACSISFESFTIGGDVFINGVDVSTGRLEPIVLLSAAVELIGVGVDWGVVISLTSVLWLLVAIPPLVSLAEDVSFGNV